MSAIDMGPTLRVAKQQRSDGQHDRLFTIHRLAIPMALVAFGLVLRTTYRGFEAGVAARVANLFGVHDVRPTGTSKLLVLPDKGSPFYALVSFGCSSLPVLLTFAVLGLVVIRAPFPRRATAAIMAATVLFVVNVLRVAGVATIGSRYGLQTMARAHDWFGTAVTLLGSVAAAATLYLMAAMPGDSWRKRRHTKVVGEAEEVNGA
jgi:exosortase/archaeosortase family protein